MKGRGVYSAAVAAIAIAVIVAVTYSSIAEVEIVSGLEYGDTIIDAKWDWQQAYNLLWLSASDAVADAAIDTGGCSFDLPSIESRLDTYFSGTLSDSVDNCIAQVTNVEDLGSNTVRIEFTLSCSRSAKGISVVYAKTLRLLEKKAYYMNDPVAGCLADVEHIGPSGAICEVDRMAGPTGCGN